MSKGCYAVFMDESGTGSKQRGKANYWVSVGVLASIDDHQSITEDLLAIKKKSMRLYNKEFKGTDLSPNHMNPGVTKTSVAEELSNLINLTLTHHDD